MSLHTDRRTFLRRSAIAAGTIWIAPVVTAVPAHGVGVGSAPPSRPGTPVQPAPGSVGKLPPAAYVNLGVPNELAYTGNDQARLTALGGAAVVGGAALVALGREDPREGLG